MPGPEPEHIQVQHILIGYQGSVPGKRITRTREEARTLAYDILQQAQGGADFDALVRRHTDDSPPGIYGMANNGVKPAGRDEYARGGMVGAFGNVGFRLQPGEIGVADYDASSSPYGWHIIKRLK
jgi:parvulin-like peptidyl-prolyl isomerase